MLFLFYEKFQSLSHNTRLLEDFLSFLDQIQVADFQLGLYLNIWIYFKLCALEVTVARKRLFYTLLKAPTFDLPTWDLSK